MNRRDNRDAAVAEVGERKARVWRLYMAASEFGFAHNIIQLHQFLLTNTTEDGVSGMPLRPVLSPVGTQFVTWVVICVVQSRITPDAVSADSPGCKRGALGGSLYGNAHASTGMRSSPRD